MGCSATVTRGFSTRRFPNHPEKPAGFVRNRRLPRLYIVQPVEPAESERMTDTKTNETSWEVLSRGNSTISPEECGRIAAKAAKALSSTKASDVHFFMARDDHELVQLAAHTKSRKGRQLGIQPADGYLRFLMLRDGKIVTEVEIRSEDDAMFFCLTTIGEAQLYEEKRGERETAGEVCVTAASDDVEEIIKEAGGSLGIVNTRNAGGLN